MKKLLVRGDDQLIAALLGAFEEVPIANVRPPQLIGGIDCVSGQGVCGVELGYPGRTGFSRARRGCERFHFVSQDSFYLPALHSGEPLEKLLDRRAILEVLKQSGNGHARPTKHPSSAELAGVPFDRRAFLPMQHPSPPYGFRHRPSSHLTKPESISCPRYDNSLPLLAKRAVYSQP